MPLPVLTNILIPLYYIKKIIAFQCVTVLKNVFSDSAFATKIRNWRSNYGKTVGNSLVFTRPDIEFTAQYVPYVAEYFTYPDPAVHHGDANADGYMNIKDLVELKNRLMTSAPYFIMADTNEDDAVNNFDINKTIKILLGLEDKYWTEAPINLDAFDKTGGADSSAASRKNTILNAADSVSVTGTTYYVAANGNDSNNGKSPSAPVKTISKVNTLPLAAGDAVLFRRGDTFRTTTKITVQKGVTYGAYGTGAKPKIYGSVKNYADKGIWSTTDGNIWSTSISVNKAENIVFNGSESAGTRKSALAYLKENGDFYFNSSTNTFYLFMNQANPGAIFDSIEISSVDYLFYAMGSRTKTVTDFSIKNLELGYAYIHGMYLAFIENATVDNCVIGWSGGGYQGDSRLGNAIQLWRIVKNCNITNNYIFQAFDAAITFQGTATNQYIGINITNNLIEYCSMNFEFWAHNSSGNVDSNARMTDVLFNNNIMRFGGMGFGGKERAVKSDQAYVLTWNEQFADGQISNFQIQNNIFDIANCNYFYAKNTDTYLTISGNTYYQTDGSDFQVANGYGDYANDAAEFAAAIGKVDASATSTQWIN